MKKYYLGWERLLRSGNIKDGKYLGSLTKFVEQASDEKMCHINAFGVIPENGPNEVKAIYLESPLLQYRCVPAARELG